jgi:oligosaccharyl transferase complex subunit OST4
MISDSSLYTLAIFLGSAAMLLIVLYHFLEVNSKDADSPFSVSFDEKASLESGGVGNAVGAMVSPEGKGASGSGGGKPLKIGKLSR